MKWITTFLFLLVIGSMGCTIKVEPLPKTPVKHYRYVQRHKVQLKQTPTPKPEPTNKPLQLEPATSSPTPMIKLPNTTWIRGIHSMDMYLG